MQPKILYHKNGKIKLIEYRQDNGWYHNEYGPAITRYLENGSIDYLVWYIDGIRHNTYGPAYTVFQHNKKTMRTEYWVNGERLYPLWFEELGFNIQRDISNPDAIAMVFLHYVEKEQ